MSATKIDIVKQLTRIAFGDETKVDMQCVTADNRVSFLSSGKIDFALASLAYTAARAEQVDYSQPYWISNLQLVVPKDSSINNYSDLAGKTVATTTGSTYATWLKTCVPEAKLALTQTVVDGTTTLQQERADAFAYIDIYNYNFVQRQQDFKVVGDLASPAIQGVGVKKGDAETMAWVNAALDKLKVQDFYFKAFSNHVKDPELLEKFRTVVPGPEKSLEYSQTNAMQCAS